MITIRKAKESETSQLEKLFLTARQQTFHWESPNKFKLEDYKKATNNFIAHWFVKFCDVSH